MFKIIIIILLILNVPLVLSFDFEGDTLFNFPEELTGNVTTNVNQTIINQTVNDSRVDNLVGFNCGGTDKVNGFEEDGTPICDTDLSGGEGDFNLNISNGTIQEVVTNLDILDLIGSIGILISLSDTNFTFDLNFTLLDGLYNETDLINSINTTENIEALGFVTGPHTEGESLNNSFYIYFNHSMNNIITYNLTEADSNIISIITQPGRKFIFGDSFT